MVNKPCVFVPYPHAQADHQTINAKTLVDQGKALLIPEGEDFSSRLRDALFELLDADRYKAMAEIGASSRPSNAAELIARGALELAV